MSNDSTITKAELAVEDARAAVIAAKENYTTARANLIRARREARQNVLGVDLYPKTDRWSPIENYPGYEVSIFGQVRSWRAPGHPPNVRRIRPLIRKLRPSNRGGYPQVMITSKDGKKRLVHVHTLVLQTFVGPRPSKSETRHLDGDVTNAQLNNLAWGTRKDQVADQARHGTLARPKSKGIRNKSAKLSDEQVKEIRLALEKDTAAALSVRFKVSPSTIFNVKNRRRYAYVT